MNVFLIETPHQLLNALEAKSFFRLANNHLIVIIKEEYTRGSYKRLVDANEWKTVYYLPLRSESGTGFLGRLRDHRVDRIRGYYRTYELFLLRRELDRLSNSMGQVDRIFVGNYWIEYMRHFANVTPYKELFLLDDGTATLLINKMRKDHWFSKNGVDSQALKQEIINSLIGLKDRHIENITYFTIYDLDVRNGDRLVKHGYPFLKGKALERPVEDAVYFLGMTLIDEGLSQDKYLEYLLRVKNHYSGQNLIYIQHRGEPQEKLDIIREDFKIEMRKFDVPIEYQISVIGNRPIILGSFCSSALENCRIIFGDLLDIQSVSIDPGDCPLWPEFIRDIYAYYRSKETGHFRVLQL